MGGVGSVMGGVVVMGCTRERSKEGVGWALEGPICGFFCRWEDRLCRWELCGWLAVLTGLAFAGLGGGRRHSLYKWLRSG